MGDVTIVRNEFADDDRAITGCVIIKSYTKWRDAIEFCEYLSEKGKIISAEFEDGDKQMVWHGCLFNIPGNVDFNADEVVALTKLLSCFDSLTVVVEDGIISCSGVSHLYRET